jgi:mRNA-degrading endonuclease RelE of RelBE toxin-antitoxin system
VGPDARPQARKNRRCIRWNTLRIFSGRERRRWSRIVRRSRKVNVGQAPRTHNATSIHYSDKVTKQILADCARLANDPIPDGKRIKKLQGWKENLYRLRAGDYRVVFKRSGTRIDIVRVLSKPDFQKAY